VAVLKQFYNARVARSVACLYPKRSDKQVSQAGPSRAKQVPGECRLDLQANPLAETHYPFIGWTRKSTQQAFRKMRRWADLKAYNLQFVHQGFLYFVVCAHAKKYATANRDLLSPQSEISS
jgi:hypothetical protein